MVAEKFKRYIKLAVFHDRYRFHGYTHAVDIGFWGVYGKACPFARIIENNGYRIEGIARRSNIRAEKFKAGHGHVRGTLLYGCLFYCRKIHFFLYRLYFSVIVRFVVHKGYFGKMRLRVCTAQRDAQCDKCHIYNAEDKIKHDKKESSANESAYSYLPSFLCGFSCGTSRHCFFGRLVVHKKIPFRIYGVKLTVMLLIFIIFTCIIYYNILRLYCQVNLR